jgi:Flagellar hook-associated protein 2 N-terminus
MATSLNFDSLSIDSGGRVSFSGLGSGIDIQGAVDAIVAAKRVTLDRIEQRVSDNQVKIAAFQDLRTLARNLKGAIPGSARRPERRWRGRRFRSQAGICHHIAHRRAVTLRCDRAARHHGDQCRPGHAAHRRGAADCGRPQGGEQQRERRIAGLARAVRRPVPKRRSRHVAVLAHCGQQ